jgi:hypothetical protein
MDWGYIGAVTLFFTIILILAQRIEPKRARIARYFILIMMALLMLRPNYTHLRGQNLVAYAIALFISLLFWLLIGRYNPVGSSDAIKVYGMDD